MSEPRAQRTLVKSPPELWAEISDVSTLARHLGEFGEIRITRLEAETTVVWEGDRARGTVNLEPSGWGTKVTLTAEAIAAETVVEPEAEAQAEPEPEPEAQAEPEPEPEPEAQAEPEAEAEAEPEPEPEPVAVEGPAPRRGLFARMLGRLGRRSAPEAQAPPAATEPVAKADTRPATGPAPELDAIHTPTVAAPEPEAEPEPEPEPVAEAEAPAPIAEPALEGEITAERVEAVLVGVLDDLGSAHHRPFSRG
jgi:hypothetical protein